MPITEVFMAAVVFSGIALIFKIIADSITRNKLINKGLVDENIKFLFSNYGKPNMLSNVKWGMVLIGIGVALFIREFSQITDETMMGLMFFFAGIAFLIYYAVAKTKIDNKS